MPLWIWQVLGWVLLPSGAVVVLMAMLRDRSRGRHRCPKCWYDMTGLLAADGSCVCPECGKGAASEPELRRTRKHWRTAVIGGVVALMGVVSMSVPGWKRGWVGVVPSSVLVYFAPANAPSPGAFGAGARLGTVVIAGTTTIRQVVTAGPALTAGEKMTDEVWRRMDTELADWQRHVFARRLLAASGWKLEDVVQFPDRWVRGEMVPVRIEPRSIRGLSIEVKDETGPIFTSGSRVLPMTGPADKRIDLEVSLHTGTRMVMKLKTTARVGLVESWATLAVPVSDAESNRAAQAALAPRMVMVDGKLAVLVRDRGDNAEWRRAKFAMEYVVEVRIGEEVIGRGRGRAEWSKVVWKDWDELEMEWSPGGEAAADDPERDGNRSGNGPE